jgi:hypothetical protein
MLTLIWRENFFYPTSGLNLCRRLFTGPTKFFDRLFCARARVCPFGASFSARAERACWLRAVAMVEVDIELDQMHSSSDFQTLKRESFILLFAYSIFSSLYGYGFYYIDSKVSKIFLFDHSTSPSLHLTITHH